MPSAPEAGGSPSPEEALRRLEQRLDQASEAAQRLMAQAAAEAAARARDPHAGAGAEEPTKTPPAGWQLPDEDSARAAPDLDPFVALVAAMRELIPPELQRRLIAALREVLLALRALIDWYLERLDRRREERVEVQDIPIL